jgi:hypothetical protein
MPVDTTFILWASAYVILKWTAGVWAVRRVKAYVHHQRARQAT